MSVCRGHELANALYTVHFTHFKAGWIVQEISYISPCRGSFALTESTDSKFLICIKSSIIMLTVLFMALLRTFTVNSKKSMKAIEATLASPGHVKIYMLLKFLEADELI